MILTYNYSTNITFSDSSFNYIQFDQFKKVMFRTKIQIEKLWPHTLSVVKVTLRRKPVTQLRGHVHEV